MEIKTVSIIGQGALGILYGQKLVKTLAAGSVRFIANAERIQRYQRDGIYCNGERCKFTYIEPDSPMKPADLLIFAVKFPMLKEAIQDASSQVGKNTIILSLLNGISSEEIIGERFGTEHLLYCVAQEMDATRSGNRLSYSSQGQLLIGSADNEITPAVTAVTELLQKAGLAYTVPRDINREMWNKFMLNVGVNQVVTAFETGYGGVQVPGVQRETMINAMREVLEIANRKGINLKPSDIDTWLGILAPFKPELMPSMRQDVLAKRKTEVELFSGTVLKMAKELHIPVPVNEFLYKRIREIESDY